ncbi:helicase associated domain-containing protein [Streptomyces sp. NPDC054786]
MLCRRICARASATRAAARGIRAPPRLLRPHQAGAHLRTRGTPVAPDRRLHRLRTRHRAQRHRPGVGADDIPSPASSAKAAPEKERTSGTWVRSAGPGDAQPPRSCSPATHYRVRPLAGAVQCALRANSPGRLWMPTGLLKGLRMGLGSAPWQELEQARWLCRLPTAHGKNQEEHNLRLGAWVSNQRSRAATRTPERVEQLSAIAMRWT